MPVSRRNTAESHLRRNNSSASNAIRSNTIDDCQRLDPEIARQHAVAAASMAYQSSLTSGEISQHDGAGVTTSIPHELRKTQSVRFFGPNAEQSGPRSITRRIAPNWNYIHQRKSRDSLITSPSNKGTPLIRADQKAHVSKSSYKKVRKSKSLFSPRKTYTEYLSDDTPAHEALQRQSRLSGSTEIAPPSNGGHKLTAEEVLLGLPNPYQTSYDQDAAIQMAQEEYRRQIEAQYANSDASHTQSIAASTPVCRSPHRKTSKLFRRTTRTTSGNQYGASVGSQPFTDTSRKGSLGHKARKISSSLRSRIKKAFGIKPEKSFPSQQVEAQRPHFSALSEELSDDSHRPQRESSVHGEGYVTRASSRNSEKEESWVQHGGSRVSSIQADFAGDIDQDGSRVTSWANSTTTDCTAPSNAVSDKKQLTVISENEDGYQPSASVNVGRFSSKSKYDAFRRPLKPGRINEPVDSQAIYSALQKRIDESQTQKSSHHRNSSDGSSRRPSLRLRRKGSVGSHQATGTTIRVIQNGSDTNNSRRNPSDVSTSNQFDEEAAGDVGDVSRPESTRSIKHKRSNADFSLRDSSQQSAAFDQEPLPVSKKKPLRATKSSFSPQRHRKSEGCNPYRIASRASGKNKSKLSRKLSKGRPHSASPNGDSIDSDSVYSRQVTGTPSGLEATLANSSSHAALETAVVEDSQVIARRYSELIGDNAEQSRAASINSTELRNWTTLQVQGLEGVPEEATQRDIFNVQGSVDGSSDQIADSAASRRPSSSAYQQCIPDQVHRRQTARGNSKSQFNFDYGFATSNALQGLASLEPARDVDLTDEQSLSETPDRYNLPLTERNCSQSNVLRHHIHEQGRESLPSYQQRSSENMGFPSSSLQHIQWVDEHYDQNLDIHKGSRLYKRPRPRQSSRSLPLGLQHDAENNATSAQTVVVRRRSPERIERLERLRRIQSSRSLREEEYRNSIDKPMYGPGSGQPGNGENARFGSPDSPYDTAGSGMLGPSMARASDSRMINFFQSSNGRTSRNVSPAFL